MLNGSEFKGSPPPTSGTDVVEVTARNYAFSLNKSTAKPKLAFRFLNRSSEAHDMKLYKTPSGVTLAQAKAALENVDGRELKVIPTGYQVNMIGYAEPGQSVNVTFAEALPTGDYAIVCYVPKGGMGDNGNPKDPKGVPHVKLGMIALLRVA